MHDMAKGSSHTSKTSNLSTSGQVKCFNLTNISAIHISSTFHSPFPFLHSPGALLAPDNNLDLLWSVRFRFLGPCCQYLRQSAGSTGTRWYIYTHVHIYHTCMYVCLHVRYLFRCFVAFYDTINIIVCVIYGFRAIGPTVPCPLRHLRDIRSSPLHLNSDVFAFIY